MSAHRATANQTCFAALAQTRNQAERVALRNRLVQINLPLVYSITARMAPTGVLQSEDLRQIGSLGLLKAVEAFDPSRGRSLSSFAVPYIRGAIQHELRDRHSLVRIPRALWDLRRRASVIQDRRRRLGLPQLAPTQLAEALGSSITHLLESLELGSVTEMRSLDAPALEDGHSDAGRPLLDQVADPVSLTTNGPDAADSQEDGVDGMEELLSPAPAHGAVLAGGAVGDAGPSPRDVGRTRLQGEPTEEVGEPPSTERAWLQHRLRQLSPEDRQLVVGHVCQGLGWAELGRELGLHPRQVQRRTLALLRRLQADGRRWQGAAPEQDSQG